MEWLNPGRETKRKSLKLDTLIRLRWLAIIGQFIAVFAVHFGLGFKLNLAGTLIIISLSACLNSVLRYKYPLNYRVDESSATALLSYDVLQLASLLYLTGGLQNPFASLFLAPVLISATILSPKNTLILGGLTFISVSFLAFWHEPLPWVAQAQLALPNTYIVGVWISIILSLAFIGLYAWRVSEEARQLTDALAATEFVLAREQHISVLDGLAAAAAHQLGTPLATIALIANELDRSLAKGSQYKEDVVTLKQQTTRCREILGKIASLGDETTGPLDTITLEHLIEEVSAPHRSFGITISVICAGKGDVPTSTRNPGILYGLGNLIENALDFAQSTIVILANWNEREVRVVIRDDGPGFAREILARLGDPYVTTRKFEKESVKERTRGGLGLGLFIAKTLLERSGARFEIENANPPDQGAVVTIIWSRADYETGSKIHGYLNM